ncbi:hypothetical protein BBJ28_00023084 [Nothophytophthora sp. Chile5]|nr:hypothetical protein BBJ28_00023084 [Nothophytophthora sp. Chile5]
MDKQKVWQRAVADLNPPGVPNSFRHARDQQNIASMLLKREFGGSRRQKTVRPIGEDKEENFWAESESAAKTLRSVTFLPDPTKIMVGEANERYVRPQGQAPPSDLTVTLTMWDFDPSWALSLEPLLTKKAMNNSRVILSHALIYNDGGFDISRCGRYLAICADFSLRQAEKEVEMEAENEANTDLEQILSAVSTQEPVGGAASPSDDVNDVSVSNLQATTSNDSSSSSETAAPRAGAVPPPTLAPPMPLSRPIHAPPPRLVPISSMHHTGAPNMLAALQSAAADLSLTMDQYMNQQIRRVRPRLHPPPSIQRYSTLEPSRSAMAPAAVPQQRYSQIRPNIALSRTRFTRNQRNRRGRLSSDNQSTWLALISLDPEQLGRVIQTCHLAETAAGGVTSVKISPTSAYVLLGYGVRDRIQRETEFPVHRVTRIYRWEDMTLLSHVESAMDDVNIALFSPICGGGFLYGTKQGKLRVCSTFRGDFHDEENCNVLDGPRRCHYDQAVDDEEEMGEDEDGEIGEEGDDDDGEMEDEDGEEEDEDDEEEEDDGEEDADMGE